MAIDQQEWYKEIEKYVEHDFFKTVDEANYNELQQSFSRHLLTKIWTNWSKTNHRWEKSKSKMAYYFSAEFLMGRWLGNTLINMGYQDDIEVMINKMAIDYNKLEDAESDAGLGNGGLGRLAACFLDSLATLNMPSMGYGIRYRYGMFEQKIINNQQVEVPDNWLCYGDSASVRRLDEKIIIQFGGHIHVTKLPTGVDQYSLTDTENITAVPYDLPVVGYKTDTVVTLRLWQAECDEGFDLNLFQNEDYTGAVSRQNQAEDISRVLYPNDRGPSGKTLRLRQQFFFVSASLQDIFRRYKKNWGSDMAHLSDAIAIQMNDTHPVIAIAELMRLLVDEELLPWESAWELTIKCCAYTNHTVLSEALEKWPIEILSTLLPRHYQLIEEINRRFLNYLRQLLPGDRSKQSSMSIIADGVVKMAWLAIVGSHSVNGVATLHSEILKKNTLKMWFDVFPEKFNNKTNGVTQRRWLLKANPQLALLISSKIGDGWITDMSQLEKLKSETENSQFIDSLRAIKLSNKKKLSDYILQKNNIVVDINSIFDVQVKRLHEYKRQLLAVLYIIWLYQKLKNNPDSSIYPRTFIFSAKAASGYKQAKLIIELINRVAEVVNSDSSVNKQMKVVFLSNYCVSLAEKIFPAADISEQISTAGYEASGTGNMKFMMNGALTLGTMDGANIEIVSQVGKDNAFIFGLTSEEVSSQKTTYHPSSVLSKDRELAAILDMLVTAPIAHHSDHFKAIHNSLVHGIDGNPADQYFILKDFRSYQKAQQDVNDLYKNSDEWTKKVVTNISSSGFFSSDRTIKEYANEIWNIKPNKG